MKSVIGQAPSSRRGVRDRSRSRSRTGTLAGLLTAAVECNPDGIALRYGDRSLTYRELDARSARLARVLLRRGAGPETMVAIALPRSVESVLAVWAVAKTGAAFVPVDPAFPMSRIVFQTSDAGVRLGLTDRAHRDALPGTVEWLALDDPDIAAETAAEPATPISYLDRPALLRAADTAYLIYTSGSTGRPKGVAVTHSGLAALCAELTARYAVTREARTLHFATTSFDAAVLELLLALGAAATLVIAPPDVYGGTALAELLGGQSITHAFLTPSALATIEPTGLDALRVVLVGGEACPPGLVRRWAHPARYFGNVYGPTESTIAVTLSGPLTADRPVTIGTAIPGMCCRVLDAALRPVGAGVIGELYVSGPGLARGYHRRSGITAQRFVPDPYGVPGGRMYRTGDLVRTGGDGAIEYLGRTDDQVKIRGFRIEPGEIDTLLSTLPGVRYAVTVDRRTASGTTTLASFVQAEPGFAPDPADLADALAGLLPRYMLPSSITVIDRIPMTHNGKADRRALRERPEDQNSYRPPADIGEELVAEVFAKVLGIQQCGADTDFFVAGGNSLLATQAAARLAESWGARIPTRLLFDHPTVAMLAKAIRSERFDAARPPLLARQRPARIPLSPAQLRFWLRNQFDTESSVDNIGFALRLTDLNVEALRAAYRDTVARHEALRTSYPADESGPRQLIHEPETVTGDFAVEEVAADALTDRVHAILRRGFDVAAEVPLRVRLLKVVAPDSLSSPNADHVLVCALHHICADGSSLAPLAKDVAVAYAARCAGHPPAWQPPQVQYADYALWQQELLGSRDDPNSLLSQQLSYWTRELAGLPDQLDLPADRPRPATASLRGAAIQRSVAPAVHAALLTLAGAHRATLFMVMRTALAVLLARLAGGADIAIGVPMTNRAEPALDGVVGMFVNTTVSRTGIVPGESFADLLDRTRERDLANFAHAEVPFEHVVDAVNPVRSPGRHPLYQVGFAFQNFAKAQLELAGSDFAVLDVDADTVKTDLHIGVVDTRAADGSPDQIVIRFGYSTDLFDEATVNRFLDGYLRVLEQVAADARRSVGDLELIDPAQRELLRSWSSGAEHAVAAESLTAAIGRWAVTTPDAVAVRCGAAVLTYRQLCDRGNRLARWLIRQGVGPETAVAVAMRRGIAQVLALYAIAEAGGAWVPIDPAHPATRIGYVLESARPRRMLTTRADALTLRDHGVLSEADAIDTLDLSAFDPAPITDADRTAPLRGAHPAYLIYTSGSTGRPKGVVVSHISIVNQLDWMRERYAVTAEDVYLQKTPATFDVSLWGYFLPLRTGARLILAGPDDHRDPAALCGLISQHRVTLTDFVPSMLAVFAAELAVLRAASAPGGTSPQEIPHTATTIGETPQPEIELPFPPAASTPRPTSLRTTARADETSRSETTRGSAAELPSLRAVFVIGEALPPETARAFAAVSAAQVHNLYGPTEAAVSITEHQVTADDLGGTCAPIGVPEWNSRCLLLDDRLRQAPIGAVGELYLAGVQLARGYHGAPAITAGRFVANPFGEPGARMYRTGDLVRWNSRGTLDYLGRTDFQVKVRGHRIELGEIETALLAEPGVGQAAVAVKPSATGDRLVAYVVAAPGATVDPDMLRRSVSRSIPGYMVPAAIVPLTEFPVNTSGKLDRPALPQPVFAARAAAAPETPLERAIAAVFAEVLGLTSVGVVDDFFELGGSSLLVFTLHQRLSAELNRKVPMAALLAAPTVGALAAHLTGAEVPTHTVDYAADAILDPDFTVAGPLPDGSMREVLLTGATGFLGVHLLHELLTRTDARVWCLVRAADPAAGLARIRLAQRHFRLPELPGERLVIVNGDLGQPRLGLADDVYAELADRVDTIVHNGAHVNHIDPYARLRPVNVLGTREILCLATTNRVKRVHYISTIGTSVPATPVTGDITEDVRMRPDQVQDNGYLTSKWVAEELVRQAGDRGLPVAVYRPGTLCGDPRTGVNSADDSFWNMIRAAAVLGMAPEVGDATVALVPVCYAAGAIAEIATHPCRNTVYHLITHTPTRIRDVLTALTAHGYPIATVDLDTVRSELDRQSAHRSATGDDSLIRAALLSPNTAILAGHRAWADTNTRNALADTGIECPPIDRATLDTYLTVFRNTGFLPHPD
ncbi:non-ribosomal peptide synthetase [Nocardia arthritidis]|uniref:non-ribosomal peptide synthetase n=1 Tax=Nocardia arthritidis TaxID=228602 RepID=UPI00142E41BD|nr:non-ribosomal peptide synthetase [Nocardia arthritidis]